MHFKTPFKNYNLKSAFFLSLIIPAFRQEKTISKDLEHIKNIMDTVSYPYELIVVIDGQIDNTFKEANKIKSKKIKIVGYKKNHGKGYAIRFGISKAKGNLIAFLDAGMDLDPKALQEMLIIMEKSNCDIVIGSKLHPLSRVKYPMQRKILSWGYRNLVKMMFGLSVKDTQVGLKLFKRKVLEDVMPRLLVKKFAFDIEILAISHYLGYKKIEEAPIDLKFTNWSSITSKNFLKPVFNMLWDTCAVFYRLKIIHYYDVKNKKNWINDPKLRFK